MDQIHHIRDMFYQQDKSITQIASEIGLNRKTISKYVDMEDFNSPPPTPASEEEHESKLDPFKHLIDEWLQADKLAPRKQRHTAKRVFRRLKDEAEGFNCSYRLVALYVKEKKEQLRLKKADGYLPLVHHPGEAQADFGFVDFYENGRLYQNAK
jgi:transposase